jgi:glutamine synthetase
MMMAISWFGFEQGISLWMLKHCCHWDFPIGGYPAPQGMYYCSVGGKTHAGIGRRHAPTYVLQLGLTLKEINQRSCL